MKIVDRYLIWEVLPPTLFAICGYLLVAAAALFLGQNQVVLLYRPPLHLMAQLLLSQVPQSLALALPMGFTLGILVGLGRLGANDEVKALRSGGVGLRRVLLPLAT
ncbi:MAG: LptF/LptG family permease, partial [Deinococcus sp.]|nr:LptF/LptG family permease [Deinococcus sp.]